MKYTIRMIGCDDETCVSMELTEQEKQLLDRLAGLVNQESTYNCMPKMTVEISKAQWDDIPITECGWYATQHCWDVNEGIFCGAHYWDGKDPGWNGTFTQWAGPFPSEDAALAWASANEVE